MHIIPPLKKKELNYYQDMVYQIEDTDRELNLASTLGRRWSRDDSMRILRRLVPDIDGLSATAMVAAASSLDCGGELEGEICEELKNLVGANYSAELIGEVRRKMCRVLMRELREESGLPRLETRSCYWFAVGGGGEEEMCSICLGLLEEEEEEEGLVATLDCGHEYHAGCITRWLLREGNVCPLCRGRALDSDDMDIDVFLLALM